MGFEFMKTRKLKTTKTQKQNIEKKYFFCGQKL